MRSMTLMPVSRIDGVRLLLLEGRRRAVDRPAGRRPSAGGRLSIGSPSTLNMRPSVFGPTGTEIAAPVSSARDSRRRPSVESIARQRTQLLPRCCCTSVTSVRAVVADDVDGVVDRRELLRRELDVDDRADDLDDSSGLPSLLCSDHGRTLRWSPGSCVIRTPARRSAISGPGARAGSALVGEAFGAACSAVLRSRAAYRPRSVCHELAAIGAPRAHAWHASSSSSATHAVRRGRVRAPSGARDAAAGEHHLLRPQQGRCAAAGAALMPHVGVIDQRPCVSAKLRRLGARHRGRTPSIELEGARCSSARAPAAMTGCGSASMASIVSAWKCGDGARSPGLDRLDVVARRRTSAQRRAG